MKLLISGSTGFVGKNLVAYSKYLDGWTISKLNFRNVLLDEDIKDHDVIIHLAGKAHDLKNVSDEEEYFEVNYKKTMQLFDVYLNSNCRDFIYFSSVKAVADSVEGILTEEVIPNAKTPYGQSKLLAENYILSRRLPVSKRVFILRPCMIHGPGNKGNLNLLYSVVKNGIPYPLADYKNERSFLSISNLLYILNAIIHDRSVKGGIYNVADDEPLSTNEIIRIISGELGRKPKLWKINPAIINILAKIGDKLHLPLNTERLMKLTESYVVSNKKIKAALNVSVLPASSRDGLTRTIKSFQANQL